MVVDLRIIWSDFCLGVTSHMTIRLCLMQSMDLQTKDKQASLKLTKWDLKKRGKRSILTIFRKKRLLNSANFSRFQPTSSLLRDLP